MGRQPSNATELGQILAAMGSAEVDCIRYRGADRGVVRALCEHGHAEQVNAVADCLPPLSALDVVKASALRRLGKPKLAGCLALLAVVIIGVTA